MQARYPEFLDYFIVEQHFRRYAGADFNNRQPLWFFVAVLPLLMLPWSLWLLPALRQRGARAGLYYWWVVVIVGFFSLPASKIVGYVMPALAPAAALLALGLAQRGTPWSRVAALAGAVCVAAVGVLAWKAPGSHRDLGRALAAQWQPGDRLAYADGAFFDLRFYAGIAEAAIVLADWDDPKLPERDNWRKELFDAARFDRERGRALLWTWQRLPELACGAPRTWIVSDREQLPRLAALPGIETVLEGRHGVLLRAGAAACLRPPA